MDEMNFYAKIIFKIVLLLYFTHCIASDNSQRNFNLTEVVPGIYVHQGLHVNFEHPQHDDIANIGFIVGKKCTAVIDTGGSFRVGKSLKNAIQNISKLPICYVINTHIHFDHLLGNIAFKADGIKFIGHNNLTNAILRNKQFFLGQYSADLGPNPSSDSIIGPDIVIEGKMELDLGGRILILTAHHAAHSHTDLTVYDKQTDTLWLSDLLFMERMPALDGNLKDWISLLKDMEVKSYLRVIPGHGPVSADWPAANTAQRLYLGTLLNETREMIAANQFMQDVIDSVGKKIKQDWLLYEQHHKRNVSKAFTELEWE